MHFLRDVKSLDRDSKHMEIILTLENYVSKSTSGGMLNLRIEFLGISKSYLRTPQSSTLTMKALTLLFWHYCDLGLELSWQVFRAMFCIFINFISQETSCFFEIWLPRYQRRKSSIEVFWTGSGLLDGPLMIPLSDGPCLKLM